MKFIRLKDITSNAFKEAWKIYSYSFPPDEKRRIKAQKEIMKNSLYSFFVVYRNKRLLGIISEWKLEDYSFIEHFAVRKSLRGRGIGTILLKEYMKKNIVLEVERPATEASRKRIRFYEKLGFKLNKYNYIQPPFGRNKKPVPLFLMTYPKSISKSEFLSIGKRIHLTAYGLKSPFLGR